MAKMQFEITIQEVLVSIIWLIMTPLTSYRLQQAHH